MSSESTRDAVAGLLAEAGMAHDVALGRALESLRGLCPPEAPAPTGLLAELLAAGQGDAPRAVAPTRAANRAADEAFVKLTGSADAVVVRFAPRKRHRGAMISAVVVAGVGLSASGVAAGGGVDYLPGVPRAESHSTSAPEAPAAEPQPAGDGTQAAGGNPAGGPAVVEPVAVVAPATQPPAAALSRDAQSPARGRGAHRAGREEPRASEHRESGPDSVVLAPAEVQAQEPAALAASVEDVVDQALPQLRLASITAAVVRPAGGRHAETMTLAKAGGKHR
ncbi:hypothetical protein [Sinomonas sp. ASV322]|uniref:hypothetical protein n=1 Tax=Sinomonas sp. ASV322 TaxID=3041920 RepID=UPI0027DAB8F8|nr:hypothetical protein [Sinomonas sp. ASV322]MDQ4502906.1 hypothetical protein [Sinomonas sp. ASV322]